MRRPLVLWAIGIAVLVLLLPTTAGFAIALGVVTFVAGLAAWTRLVERSIRVETHLPDRLVQGELGTMTVTIANHSPLPAPRVRVEVRLPPGRLLPSESLFEVALPPRAAVTRQVEVTAYVRGRWQPPPARIEVSDPWGAWVRQREEARPNEVVVFPAIVPVRRVDLPAISPLAEVPDRRSLTTDPTAIVGVRPYQPGDPLRTIHWPATAAVGELVRRETERAWARDLVVVLDLERDRWPRYDGKPVEVAVSAAASLLAHAILTLRQPAGLVASLPAEAADDIVPPERRLPPVARFRLGASRAHLDAMLVHLAGCAAHPGTLLPELLRREGERRTPGTTLAVITSTPDLEVIDALRAVRRRGLAPVLLEVGEHEDRTLRGSRRLPRIPVEASTPLGSTQL